MFGIRASKLALVLFLGFGACISNAQTPQSSDEAGLTSVEKLGKRLFEDINLSEPRGQSCASCHDPAKAFQGNAGSPNPALARGAIADRLGNRKVQLLTYAAFSPKFGFQPKKDEETGKVEMVAVGGYFWDGRADDLEAQVEGPLLNPREMNNPSKRAVIDKVRASAYADLVREAFGADALDDADKAFSKISSAIAAFERTPRFSPFSSKFDDVLRGKAKFSKLEAKGFALFKDRKKGNCLACHVGDLKSRDPNDWLFTDFTYDALGAPRNRDIPDNRDAAYFDGGLCKRPGLAAIAPSGFEIDSVCGAFKAPTLRNIAVTGPYMHNGVFKSLHDAVAFYFTRDTNPERWYQRGADGTPAKFDDLPDNWRGSVNVKEAPYDRKPGQKPRASDAEIDAIVAFLHTLTDQPFQSVAGK